MRQEENPTASRESFVRELERYACSSVYDVEQKTQFLSFVRREPRCAERTVEEGHLTGSGIVWDPVAEKLLLIHHKKLDRWQQPGGHADGSFDLIHTAIREVEEETGIITDAYGAWPFDLSVHVIPASTAMGEHLHYDVRTLLIPVSTTIIAAEGEVHAAGWFTLEETIARLTPDTSLMSSIDKLKRLLPLDASTPRRQSNAR